MPSYTLSPIFNPQFIANAAAALVFSTLGAPSAVPANQSYRLEVLRVANQTNAPVTLQIWRVNSGGANDAQHTVTPLTVIIPPATQTFPHFDVTALWGAVLLPGDAIWAVAGSAAALNAWGDGAIIVN